MPANDFRIKCSTWNISDKRLGDNIVDFKTEQEMNQLIKLQEKLEKLCKKNKEHWKAGKKRHLPEYKEAVIKACNQMETAEIAKITGLEQKTIYNWRYSKKNEKALTKRRKTQYKKKKKTKVVKSKMVKSTRGKSKIKVTLKNGTVIETDMPFEDLIKSFN